MNDEEFSIYLSKLHARYDKVATQIDNLDDFLSSAEEDDLDFVDSDYSTLAQTSYLQNNDTSKYKEYMNISVLVSKQFLHLDEVDESYVTILNYHNLLNSLSTGDLTLSKEYASLLNYEDFDKQYCSEVDCKFGYCVRDLILDKLTLKQIDDAKAVCTSKKGIKAFLGYLIVFEGILNNSQETIDKGFEQLLKDHKRLCGEGKLFNHTGTRLAVWAVGLANFLISKGFKFNIESDLVPAELILN